MNTSRFFYHAVWVLTVMFFMTLLGCGGCAFHEPPSGDKPRKPVVWELSPEARGTYAYLLYEQALRQGDEVVLLAAVRELETHEAPLSVYVEATVWLMSRKSAEAMPFLEKGLKAFPSDISLNLLYAEQLQDLGQGAKALAHMQAYVTAHPDSSEAKLELALLMVKNDRFGGAEQTLASIVGEKRTPLVEYYHARALIGMRREADAMRHLRKALKMAPEFVEAMAELAYIHEQRKELHEARALYEAMLRQGDSAQEVLLRLIALSLRLNQSQRALEFARKGPDTTAFKTTVAGMLIEAKQYAEAEPLLRTLVAAPDAPQDLYFFLAAVAYEGRKDMTTALQWLEKVTPDASAYARAIVLRTQLLNDAGRPEEALDVLRTAQRSDPEQKEYRDMEIRLLAHAKRMDEALRAAADAVQHWPDDASLAFLRASLLEESGDKKGAMIVMEGIITRHPDYYQALNYVGYTLAEQNRDLPRALALLHKAVELSPRSDYILDSLAWAQFRAGNIQDAWETICKAVELSVTGDPTIWEHYADIATALGKKEEARQGYYKALEFKPANEDSLRERLSQP